MAIKRMFNRAIIDTDRFMDMQMSAKALYFLLGMEADDEGFVSYRKVMRIHGGQEDDINVLAVKNFVVKFPSGVIVITDWNDNNYLDKNRIKPTEYQTEKAMLLLTDKKKYVLNECLTRSVEKSIEEISAVTSTAKSSEPFSLKAEIQKLEDSPRRDLNVIGLYFDHRKPDFENYEQYTVALKRHLRAAKDVKVFNDDQILKALDRAKKLCPEDYTIETLKKMLTK